MPVPTTEQIKKLKSMFDELVADNDAANDLTAAAKKATADAVAAQAVAAQSNLDEQAADAKVTADIAAITAAFQALAGGDQPTPPAA